MTAYEQAWQMTNDENWQRRIRVVQEMQRLRLQREAERDAARAEKTLGKLLAVSRRGMVAA